MQTILSFAYPRVVFSRFPTGLVKYALTTVQHQVGRRGARRETAEGGMRNLMRDNDDSLGRKVDHAPIRACIDDMGASAIDVARATGIALPKVLRVMGLAGGARSKEALDGFELVQLLSFVGLPVSAVVMPEEDR